MSYLDRLKKRRPGSKEGSRPTSAVSRISRGSKGSKGNKSLGGGSGFSGTTGSSRYVFAENLESYKDDFQKKFTVTKGYEPFEDVPKYLVEGVRELFLNLYKVYSMKPFLEPLDEQVGMQDETLEVTFGIAEECKKVIATVSSIDDWLVDNKKINIEYTGDGYCTLYVTPEKGQFGECIMTLYIEDPVGNNTQSFSIQFMEQKKKKGTKKKKVNASAMEKLLGEDQEDLVDYEEEEVTRDANARKWSVEDLGNWLFENNFLMLKQKFVDDKIDGPAFLKLTQKDFTKYGVKKMKTKKQLEAWVLKLNDDADMLEYAEEQDRLAVEEKAAARARLAEEQQESANAATPSNSRPGTRGSMGSSVMSLSRPGTAQSSKDVWENYPPSIAYGICTPADTDAYVVAFEIGKIGHLHRIILRESIFVDLTADDGRVCLAAALSTPFQKIIGIETRFGEFERGKVYIDRYKKKVMPSLTLDKQRQAVLMMNMEPLKYDGISKARTLWVDWRYLRDEYNKRQNRCYKFMDFERNLKWQPSNTFMFIVNDEEPTEYPDDREDFKLEDKVPGHEIDKWSIVDRTEHVMSTGNVIIYCYRKTGQSHIIETPETNIYDFMDEFTDDEEEEEEDDDIDLLPKDKLRSYVQEMYEKNSHYAAFVNSSRQMLLSRGTNLSRGQSRGSMAESYETLFAEKDPIEVRNWRPTHEPEFITTWDGPSRSNSRQASRNGSPGARTGSSGGLSGTTSRGKSSGTASSYKVPSFDI